ncbi:hypothetical protein HDU76_008832 [Blyttiomyces sp. JEL0837]|nr:hypothetical protein HDU76_008832 [Blyttiomyces sp. JEL0837]
MSQSRHHPYLQHNTHRISVKPMIHTNNIAHHQHHRLASPANSPRATTLQSSFNIAPATPATTTTPTTTSQTDSRLEAYEARYAPALESLTLRALSLLPLPRHTVPLALHFINRFLTEVPFLPANLMAPDHLLLAALILAEITLVDSPVAMKIWGVLMAGPDLAATALAAGNGSNGSGAQQPSLPTEVIDEWARRAAGVKSAALNCLGFELHVKAEVYSAWLKSLDLIMMEVKVVEMEQVQQVQVQQVQQQVQQVHQLQHLQSLNRYYIQQSGGIVPSTTMGLLQLSSTGTTTMSTHIPYYYYNNNNTTLHHEIQVPIIINNTQYGLAPPSLVQYVNAGHNNYSFTRLPATIVSGGGTGSLLKEAVGGIDESCLRWRSSV